MTDTIALIDAAKAGNREAFGALFAQYQRQIFLFLLTRVRDPLLADDLCQDVFRRTLMAIHRYEHRGADFGAYLTTIARNLIVDYYRSGSYRFEPVPAGISSYAERNDGDRWTDPEYCATHGAVADTLTGAIAQLSGAQRLCIELRFMRGLTVAETAALVGKNEGAVKQLLARATGALRRDPAVAALR